jgi:hypothetical protein
MTVSGDAVGMLHIAPLNVQNSTPDNYQRNTLVSDKQNIVRAETIINNRMMKAR